MIRGGSGLIALLHRLGLDYHKPNVIPRKLDEEKQKAFIASYEKLLNSLADNEAMLFADAVHPTHAHAGPHRTARDRTRCTTPAIREDRFAAFAQDSKPAPACLVGKPGRALRAAEHPRT